MFITTVMPISTLLKIAFVFIIAIIIIRYVDKLRKTSFRGGKSINYLLKRNTKAFFKNSFASFGCLAPFTRETTSMPKVTPSFG